MTNAASLLPGVPLIESPLFAAVVEDMPLTAEERGIARSLNENGYAVLDFPDPEIDQRIERIKANLAPRYNVDVLDSAADKTVQGGQRIQDAWEFDADVKEIAVNAQVIDLLSRLYGRRAFPFQTLNFPVGTQQHLHSDSVHFSSLPERFMCGVWLAMEDIHPDAGPLTYVPGSHKWPILSNAMIGRRGFRSQADSAQTPYEAAWRMLAETSGSMAEIFVPKKGQALIWTANLLHGGSPQIDPRLTRWSQVTHYYFERCLYYTPAYSDEVLGRLDLRRIINIATGKVEPNLYLDEEIGLPQPQRRKRLTRWMKRVLLHNRGACLPKDFDPATYYALNPDVAEHGLDAAAHYLEYGVNEGRRYRI